MAEVKLAESTLSALRTVIRHELGLDIRPDSINSFSDKITQASRELGYDSPSECIHSLVSHKLSRREIEVLASYLTVGETYFFRDPKSFALLEHHVFPTLIREKRENRTLRIWSAACATGEEPYSLAMVLMKLLPDWKKWRITILATDINTHFLGKAIKGRYARWSFRTTPDWAKQRFFRKVSERTFDIDPQVRQMVTFSYLNLAEDSYPSLRNNTNAMDLILCRNVLIYFGHQMRKHVLAGMHRSLAEGGCLLVSPVEASRQQFGAYEQRSIDGVTFYCRGGAGRPKTEAVPEQPAYKESAKAASLPPSAPLQAPAVSVPATPPLPEMPARPPAPRQVEQKAHREGNFYHAEHLFKQGHYEEAAAELLICTPAPRVQLLLSRVYANLGDFDLAHHWCSAAIQSNPLDPHARYLLSTILQEQGRIEEAVAALRHTLYLDQHFILAHYSLASLLSQSGKKDLAHRHFQNAYQMASELPDQQVVPESDGLPAGRLVELIRLSLQAESNT